MPDYSLETSYPGPVAGVDEAGYGPWAGPVVAAAVILAPSQIPDAILDAVNDSKQLSKAKREALFKALHQCAHNKEGCWIGVGEASPQEIDQINIRQANFKAMQRAVEGLSLLPRTILVDGVANPPLPIPTHTVTKGDRLSLSIAAASIIAKVTRDRIMTQLSQEFPDYGWERNAGYGTKGHQQALMKYGVTAHHRHSYKPIQALLNVEEAA